MEVSIAAYLRQRTESATLIVDDFDSAAAANERVPDALPRNPRPANEPPAC